ncbi:hypothetical protein BBL97_04450 [Vibrio parahaemolyticus]|uniref:hypothetical protein n=1 Tax=Vibrio parahaemolyticus TaxID=670 RepID=UPI00084A66A2|nr:hypothetical protein [Vibrio parahaemolyticus]ODW92420.1 hypothetical protein BBL95_13035 [Vibrio parahaemolyticus]ODX07151.1 hypothetical protein BBL96_10520 [Vibrio parahaemolyticus]ODX10740.1 hypothetical protein BBL97_04450 [Vibrio parahaemolyticus]ODX14018.1 hypothetical protein BBL98_00530 [Vibrio parahaemolyticus]ODX18068.1 hypothetical protein BBL99_11815 [Vibrio parahaemolyticus]
MARRKIDLSILGDDLKLDNSVSTTETKESVLISQKETQNKENSKFMSLNLPKSLLNRIIASDLHSEETIQDAISAMIKIGQESETVFSPKSLSMANGNKLRYTVKIPDGFEGFFADTVKLNMLPNHKSRFVVHLIEWVLNGCPEMNNEQKVLSEEEMLVEVIRKSVLLISNSTDKKTGKVMNEIGLSNSDYTRLNQKRMVGLTNVVKKLNNSKFGIEIDTKKDLVKIKLEDETEIKSFDKFISWKAFH